MSTDLRTLPLKAHLSTWSIMLIAMLTIAASSALGSHFTPTPYVRSSLQPTAGTARAPAAPAGIESAGQARFSELAQNYPGPSAPSPQTTKPVVQTNNKKKHLNPTTSPCMPQIPCPHP